MLSSGGEGKRQLKLSFVTVRDETFYKADVILDIKLKVSKIIHTVYADDQLNPCNMFIQSHT